MSVREHWINVRVNPEELARIREKQKELGIRNTGAYMRKMAMDGYCVNLDLSDVAQVSILLRRCSNNLNQYAKRANESGSIYAEDIRDSLTAQMCGISVAHGTDETVCAVTYFLVYLFTSWCLASRYDKMKMKRKTKG